MTLVDTIIREGHWNRHISLPASPGFDCVGIVVQCGENVEKAGYCALGDKVTALLEVGGNSSYISLNVNSPRIFKVPKGLDDCDACCMVSVFMTAYQALYRTWPIPRKKNMEGKKILVIEGDNAIGQALIQLLQRAGGVSCIFTTVTRYENSDFLRFIGAEPLERKTAKWLSRVKGKMDLVFDISCACAYESSKKALNSTGQLISIGTHNIHAAPSDCCITWPEIKARHFMSRTHYYDIIESCENKPHQFKHDLEYLFELLKQKKINPNINGKISLSEVSNVHTLLEEGRLSLTVCQPWRTETSLG